MQTKPTLWDFVMVIILFVIAIVLIIVPILNKQDGVYVNINVRGEVQTYDISNDTMVSIDSNGYILIVLIEDRSVRILESNCSDKICVNTGIIDTVGESIVCAPAEVVVYISGGNDNVDHIVG